MAQTRTDNEPAFVLHTRPYRETSLVLEVFTRHHGRMALVARGARRPGSAMRGQVQPFTPLLLSWFGKSEVRTLRGAEWQGGLAPLAGMALLCGFYLNELLLKLLARDDPHEALFDYYHATLGELAQPAGNHLERILRRFERHLLSEIGYAATFHEEAESARPVREDLAYYFVPERGPYSRPEGGTGIPVSGRTLLDMDQDRFDSPVTRAEAKQLMRALINHHLGGKPLYTRQMLKELIEK
ncbi:MAG: DNA repair protein RecO [Pseudomonadota bacterium]